MTNFKGARLKALFLYLKRIVFWNMTLPRYITGDFFARQCDFVYSPSRFRFIDRKSKSVIGANTIFCESHNLEKFLSKHGKDLTARVLVLGNSDRDFDLNMSEIPLCIEKIYAQNLNFIDSKFKVLPIGLENIRLGRNAFVFFNPKVEKKHKILVGPFSDTHEERRAIASLNFSSIPSTVISEYLSVFVYRNLISQHRFVLCPRGNGMDTHRFWEVLYAGGVPIVKRSNWSSLLAQEGLHFIEVDNWTTTDLSTALHNFIESNHGANQRDYLTKSYWRNLLNV
jgi:hypothetical protein